jgi:hypothetical protein
MSIVGAVLSCVGLGALKGAFTGLKTAIGAWKAAGGLAGQGGVRVLAAATGKNAFASMKGLVTALSRGSKGVTAAADDIGEVLARGVVRRPDGVVEITLKMKPGWTPPQVRAAMDKVAAVNARGPVVTQVPEQARGLRARRLWESVHGKITQKLIDVDHILDLQLGGRHVITNLQLLDRSVNRSLGAQIANAIKRAGLGYGTKVQLII